MAVCGSVAEFASVISTNRFARASKCGRRWFDVRLTEQLHHGVGRVRPNTDGTHHAFIAQFDESGGAP
jgi:hypothetical protein